MLYVKESAMTVGSFCAGKHYILIGCGAFLHFGAVRIQGIGITYSKMHQCREKVLIVQGLSAVFYEKKKTVGRYDCINLLFLICVRTHSLIQ